MTVSCIAYLQLRMERDFASISNETRNSSCTRIPWGTHRWAGVHNR